MPDDKTVKNLNGYWCIKDNRTGVIYPFSFESKDQAVTYVKTHLPVERQAA